MIFNLQSNLGEGLQEAFKLGRPGKTTQLVSTPMSAEVFLYVFGAIFRIRELSVSRLLFGFRAVCSFADLQTILRANGAPSAWFRHAKDGFVARVDSDSPITISFQNKLLRTYSHKSCPKCSVAHRLEDIHAGLVSSVCDSVETEGLRQTSADISFTRHKHNSSLVYCAINRVPYCA